MYSTGCLILSAFESADFKMLSFIKFVQREAKWDFYENESSCS